MTSIMASGVCVCVGGGGGEERYGRARTESPKNIDYY